jgi:hypothetical protein
MVVLLRDSPIFTEELRVTIGFLATSLTKAFLFRISQFGRAASSRKEVLVVPNFFHLKMMETTVFLGPSMLQKCFGTLPQICASTQSYLRALRTIPSTSWLGVCSDMHCQLLHLM